VNRQGGFLQDRVQLTGPGLLLGTLAQVLRRVGGVRIAPLQVRGNVRVLRASRRKRLEMDQVAGQFLAIAAIELALAPDIHRIGCAKMNKPNVRIVSFLHES
jgi:hypothetical protein